MAWPEKFRKTTDDKRRFPPLARAFSHADSRKKRPLFEALDNGFSGIEVDVWLADGQLLVGHDRHELLPGRTLEALYLKPLAELARQNGGRIYPSSSHSVQLMIDVKTSSEPAYRAVHELLVRYKDILTTFAGGSASEAALTIMISGERPLALMESQDIRYAAYDGRLADLGSHRVASFIPVISDEWSRHFSWRGEGEMPSPERSKLHDIVGRAHANGQRVRFWATPENPPQAREVVWKELVAAKVDYINTDHLSELHKWLRTNDLRASVPETAWFASRRKKFFRNPLNILKARRQKRSHI